MATTRISNQALDPVVLAPTRRAKWRAALGRMKATGYRPKVLFAGDSKMMGAGAGVNTTFTSGAAAKRKTAILARQLTGMGIPAHDQGILSHLGLGSAAIYSAYDPRVSLGSGWSISSGGSELSLGGQAFRTTTVGGNLSYAFEGTIDTVDVLYIRNGGFGTIAVADGATPVGTIDSSITPAAFGRSTVSLSSRASGKTVNISMSAGAQIDIIGAVGYDSQTPAIELMNAGRFGSTTSNWRSGSSAWSPSNAIANYAPDLTFISLGVNNRNQGLSIDTFISDISAMVTQALTTGDCVIVNESYGAVGYGTDAENAAYRAAMITIADANGCLFHDEADRVNYAGYASWFSDTIHEKDFAHADEALAMLPFILP